MGTAYCKLTKTNGTFPNAIIISSNFTDLKSHQSSAQLIDSRCCGWPWRSLGGSKSLQCAKAVVDRRESGNSRARSSTKSSGKMEERCHGMTQRHRRRQSKAVNSPERAPLTLSLKTAMDGWMECY